MSDNTNTAPEVKSIFVNENGNELEWNVTKLTKGKGKDRTVMVPAPKYATNIEDLITFIRAFPQCVGYVYKEVLRAPALAASEGNVKSAEDINEHGFTEDYIAQWSVQRATNPLKQAEEEYEEFKKEHEELELQMLNSAEVSRIHDAAQQGDESAKIQFNKFMEYGNTVMAKMQKINRLRREAALKKSKKVVK